MCSPALVNVQEGRRGRTGLGFPPMNRREKFDVASFILGGEIRNHRPINTHTKNTETVTDTFTPCLSACVDNKL